MGIYTTYSPHGSRHSRNDVEQGLRECQPERTDVGFRVFDNPVDYELVNNLISLAQKHIWWPQIDSAGAAGCWRCALKAPPRSTDRIGQEPLSVLAYVQERGGG